MTDTPLTDAITDGIKARCRARGFHVPEDVSDLDEHARTLERQLAAATARLEAAEKSARLRHELLKMHHADAMALWAALKELSFGCFAGLGVCAPSTEVYNATFAILKKHEQSYSEEMRNANVQGNAAIDAAQGSNP